jgi:hypothetical protein
MIVTIRLLLLGDRLQLANSLMFSVIASVKLFFAISADVLGSEAISSFSGLRHLCNGLWTVSAPLEKTGHALKHRGCCLLLGRPLPALGQAHVLSGFVGVAKTKRILIATQSGRQLCTGGC